MTETFEKHTEITKTDDERQIAVGVAMVPNEVDRQGDWESAETIQQLSEGYMERLAQGAAGNGVMHASFPGSDTVSHVENRVLESAEKVGDETYPAGTWVIAKRVKDSDLWSLVESGTLSGFSIGGRVHEAKEHKPTELPDDHGEIKGVRGDAESVREIITASVHEISFVDTPAVQRAQIATTKSDGLLKANPALTESVGSATEFLADKRGHDEQSARELAEFLNRKESAVSPTPSDGSASWVSRAKSFFSRRDGGEQKEASHAMTDTEKQGRVLSGENVQKAMALHDIAIDLLDGTDVRQNRLRFSDDISTEFSLSEFAGAQKAAITKQGTEIHQPSFSGTTTANWDSPDLNDFTSESWADLSADERSSIGDNFFVSQSGFPADNFGDLALPVVEPSGELNLNGLQAADSYVGRTGGLSSSQESQIESWIDSMEQDNFDVESIESAQQSADPTGRGSGRDAASETEPMNQDEMERIAELTAEKVSGGADGEQDEKNADGEDEETSKVDDLTETVKQLAETVEEQGENQQQILERIENAEGQSQQKATASTDTDDGTWGKSSPFAPEMGESGGD